MEAEPLKPVKIFIKILPSENDTLKYLRVAPDYRGVYVKSLEDTFRKADRAEDFYEVDKVITNINMEQQYDEIMGGVLNEVINGNDVIIIAYGQTNSGKTSTISGLHNTSYEDRGIGPRIGSNLLDLKNDMQRFMKINIHMSYVELKSHGGNDLLLSFPNHFNFVGMKNVKKINISDEYFLYKTLYKAEGRKEFVDAGYWSNVATSVLTFYVTRLNLSYSSKADVHATIHILDLAGVDTIGKSSLSKLKSRVDISRANVQKSQLEQLFLSFNGNIDEIRIKQRLNILLQYLGNSLRPSTIYRLICHMQKSHENLALTHSMLRLSSYAQKLRAHKKSLSSKTLCTIDQLKLTVEELKREKLHTKMFRYKEYCNILNKERVTHIKNMIEEYILDKCSEMTIYNVTYVELALKMFKEIYYKEREDNESHLKRIYDKAYTDALNSLKAKKDKKPTEVVSKQSTITSSKTSSTKSSKISNKSPSKVSRSIDSKSMSGSKRSNELSKNSDSKTNIPSKVSTEIQQPETKPVSKDVLGAKTSTVSITLSEGKRRTKTGQGPSRISSSKIPAVSVADGTEGKSKLAALPLPEMLPTQGEIWEAYTKQEHTNYQCLLSAYLDNMRLTSEENQIYVNELNKLKEYVNLENIRKDELLQAETMARLTEPERYDSNGDIILSRWEIVCQENLDKITEQVYEQQEVLLTEQAKLRMYLSQMDQIKKDISKDFEEFSLKHYSIPATCTVEITEIEEKTIASQMLGDDITISGLPSKLTARSKASYVAKEKIAHCIPEFSECMAEEMKKKKQYMQRINTWK